MGGRNVVGAPIAHREQYIMSWARSAKHRRCTCCAWHAGREVDERDQVADCGHRGGFGECGRRQTPEERGVAHQLSAMGPVEFRFESLSKGEPIAVRRIL